MACDGECDQVAYIADCDDDPNNDCYDLEIPLHSGKTSSVFLHRQVLLIICIKYIFSIMQ